MQFVVCAIALVLSLFPAQPLFAAQARVIQGSEMSVNTGIGFQRVSGAAPLNPGDSVMVGPTSQAEVVYPDGCAVNINPGAVYTITARSPCSSGPSPSIQGQAGFGLSPTTLALGAAGALGLGAGIFLLTRGGNDSSSATPAPSSP